MRRGEAVPSTREQAHALLEHVHYDVSELTQDQLSAVRELFGLPAGGEEAPGA